jgi:hypothetical protein
MDYRLFLHIHFSDTELGYLRSQYDVIKFTAPSVMS